MRLLDQKKQAQGPLGMRGGSGSFGDRELEVPFEGRGEEREQRGRESFLGKPRSQVSNTLFSE